MFRKTKSTYDEEDFVKRYGKKKGKEKKPFLIVLMKKENPILLYKQIKQKKIEKKFKNSIAFEPTKKTFKLLQSNIFLNEVDDKIQAYNLAISNKKANLYLAIKRGNIGGNYISKNKQKNTEIVKSDILDNYTYNLNKNILQFLWTLKDMSLISFWEQKKQ